MPTTPITILNRSEQTGIYPAHYDATKNTGAKEKEGLPMNEDEESRRREEIQQTKIYGTCHYDHGNGIEEGRELEDDHEEEEEESEIEIAHVKENSGTTKAQLMELLTKKMEEVRTQLIQEGIIEEEHTAVTPEKETTHKKPRKTEEEEAQEGKEKEPWQAVQPTEEIQSMAGKNDDDEETRPKKRIAVEKDQSKEAAARIHRKANGESTIGDQETTEDKEKRKDTEVETGDEAESVSDQSEVSRVRVTAEISETTAQLHQKPEYWKQMSSKAQKNWRNRQAQKR